MATIAMKMTFIALLTGAGPVFFCFCFFPPQSFRKNLEGSGGERAVRGGKEAIPTPPFATCVLSFRVECCCLLALQERERVKKKKYCGGVYPSYVHYFSATYVLYTKKKKKKSLKKEKTGGNGKILLL